MRVLYVTNDLGNIYWGYANTLTKNDASDVLRRISRLYSRMGIENTLHLAKSMPEIALTGDQLG